MNTRHYNLQTSLVTLLTGCLCLTSHCAFALTLTNLKGQRLESLYGQYAPHGDCKREPGISVSDNGFAFEVDGGTTYARTFEYDLLAYTGPGGSATEESARLFDFYPFADSENDWGPVLATIDSSQHTITMHHAFTMVGTRDVIASVTPRQAAMIKYSPYFRCKGTAPPTRPAKAITPAPAPAPAITLDWNSLPLLVGKYQNDFDLYGKGSIAADLKNLLGTKLDALRRNLDVAGPLQREGAVYYLSGNAPHQGGEDMAYVLFDAARHAVQVGLWEHGKLRVYAPPGGRIAPPADIREMLDRNPPEDAVAAPGVPWQTRPIAGHAPVAVAVVAASTYIMTLSVFCDRGRPVLAMLLHRPPPSVPLTLTMVFHMGWVNVPMGRGNSAGTLWLADLSGSQLSRMLSSQVDVAYLRLNGDMQGEVSLKGAAAASQSALSSCD